MICQETRTLKIDRIIKFAKKNGVVRAHHLEKIGATRTLLAYLEKKGIFRRIARGSYILANHIPQQPGYIEIAAAAPRGVLCLLSALQYHEITTQMPNEAWVAIERGKHIPVASGLNIKIVQLRKKMFYPGIEEHESDGVVIRTYSPAKTVVDCFRFRNQIGIDVAREALKDCLYQKKANRDEIWQLAKTCRVWQIMRPYLEMT